MNKFTGFIGLKELIQIESVLLHFVIRKLNSLFHLVTDELRHLISKQGESG